MSTAGLRRREEKVTVFFRTVRRTVPFVGGEGREIEGTVVSTVNAEKFAARPAFAARGRSQEPATTEGDEP